jgi:hypothetical protein
MSRRLQLMTGLPSQQTFSGAVCTSHLGQERTSPDVARDRESRFASRLS